MGWQSPVPGDGTTPEAGAVVLMDYPGQRRRGMVLLAVCGGAGLVMVIVALVGLVGDAVAGRVALGVFGAFFIVVGLLPVLTRRTWNRPHRLLAEPAGVRWDDPYGTPWTVSWPELTAVAIVSTDKLVRSTTGTGSFLITMVSLELTPRDAGFPDRHPEMAHHWQRRGGYRSYRFGMPDEHRIAVADQALRRYAPAVYRGIIREHDPRLPD